VRSDEGDLGIARKRRFEARADGSLTSFAALKAGVMVDKPFLQGSTLLLRGNHGFLPLIASEPLERGEVLPNRHHYELVKV